MDVLNIEIFNQPHQMTAEGKHDYRPEKEDIIEYLLCQGFFCYDFEISFDHMMNLWCWSCRIEDIDKEYDIEK